MTRFGIAHLGVSRLVEPESARALAGIPAATPPSSTAVPLAWVGGPPRRPARPRGGWSGAHPDVPGWSRRVLTV